MTTDRQALLTEIYRLSDEALKNLLLAVLGSWPPASSPPLIPAPSVTDSNQDGKLQKKARKSAEASSEQAFASESKRVLDDSLDFRPTKQAKQSHATKPTDVLRYIASHAKSLHLQKNSIKWLGFQADKAQIWIPALRKAYTPDGKLKSLRNQLLRALQHEGLAHVSSVDLHYPIIGNKNKYHPESLVTLPLTEWKRLLDLVEDGEVEVPANSGSTKSEKSTQKRDLLAAFEEHLIRSPPSAHEPDSVYLAKFLNPLQLSNIPYSEEQMRSPAFQALLPGSHGTVVFPNGQQLQETYPYPPRIESLNHSSLPACLGARLKVARVRAVMGVCNGEGVNWQAQSLSSPEPVPDASLDYNPPDLHQTQLANSDIQLQVEKPSEDNGSDGSDDNYVSDDDSDFYIQTPQTPVDQASDDEDPFCPA